MPDRKVRHAAVLRTALIALLACSGLLALIGSLIPSIDPEIGSDFVAFRCAASIVLHHAAPYQEAPLHACEAVSAPVLIARIGTLTIPAPLPPPALLVFVPFAVMPANVAIVAWILLSISAVIATTMLLRLVLPCGALPVAAFVLLTSVFAGQIVPLLLLCWTVAVLALRTNRYYVAAFALCIGLIEPHLGLWPILACAIASAPMRRPLAIVGCAVGGCTLAMAPYWHGFWPELQLQASAELAMSTQYSLAHFLYDLSPVAVRAHEPFVLGLASMQWALVGLLGTLAAARAYRTTEDAGRTIFLALTGGVIGGAYVHLSQLAVALPLALTIPASSPIARVAISLLIVPWSFLAAEPGFAVVFVGVLGLVWQSWGMPVGRSLAVAAAVIATWLTALRIMPYPHQPVLLPVHEIVAVGAAASTSWWAYANGFLAGPEQTLTHLPTLLGLIFVFGVAVVTALTTVNVQRDLRVPA